MPPLGALPTVPLAAPPLVAGGAASSFRISSRTEQLARAAAACAAPASPAQAPQPTPEGAGGSGSGSATVGGSGGRAVVGTSGCCAASSAR
jgi:hypothetical protein